MVATDSLAILGGRIVPVEGDVIERGTVLIEDGRIAAIGGPELVVPAGTTVVPAEGSWVLPGFIDAHTHLVATSTAW